MMFLKIAGIGTCNTIQAINPKITNIRIIAINLYPRNKIALHEMVLRGITTAVLPVFLAILSMHSLEHASWMPVLSDR